MKHVVNTFGLFLLLLGFVIAADTAWGLGFDVSSNCLLVYEFYRIST